MMNTNLPHPRRSQRRSCQTSSGGRDQLRQRPTTRVSEIHLALIDDTHMRPTRLLIEPERQHDATRRRPALPDERLQHVHDADEPALVVRRAAAPDTLAIEEARVRRMRPRGDGVRGDGDDVYGGG